jgi:hypothetical protein
VGGQPLGRDGSPAAFARPVGPVRQAVEGGVELGQILAGLGGQVDDQGPLEADGRALGIVLVVGRGQGGGLDDVAQVALETGEAGGDPPALAGQQRAYVLGKAGVLGRAGIATQAGATVATSSSRSIDDRPGISCSVARAFSSSVVRCSLSAAVGAPSWAFRASS